ncbi:MAG: asparagine synthetase A [Candidatus ainarchaeum sp.]|nr:asparagine synthetase A [Candidatus ainarchaeum sp.]
MILVYKIIEHIKKSEMKDILKIQSAVLKATHDFMWLKEMTQLMPVMLSSVTDPLAHDVFDSSIIYDGQRLELTKSMILHKQISMSRGDMKGIYIVSPNIRLERPECKDSGRHLIEFSQVDIELKDATGEEFRKFMEELIVYILSFVKKECKEELERIGRKIEIPKTPFKVYDSVKLKEVYGADYEKIVSEKEKEPFWITDLYREFYDKEDPISKKHLNYDLIYPEGFGEGLSGAEREHIYDIIIEKMERRKTDPKMFEPYLKIAKEGHLIPTAGGGFGVERMVRFLTGKKHIREATLFPRVPGEGIEI